MEMTPLTRTRITLEKSVFLQEHAGNRVNRNSVFLSYGNNINGLRRNTGTRRFPVLHSCEFLISSMNSYSYTGTQNTDFLTLRGRCPPR